MCRNCGALVGAGEGACAMCGTPVTGGARQELATAETHGPEPPHHDLETMRFARAVLTRPSTFTFVFLAINVFIFLLMSYAAPGGSENNEVLRAYGAKYNSLINAGEWWRLVTPVFLHIGWIHLLVNMYSLFILGPYVEKLYGSARFVFFWIATGVAGVVASYFASGTGMRGGTVARFLFRGGDGPSAGASGALFGLIGVLFVFGIKFRHELPEGFKRAFGTGMIPTILINLFIGYTIPYIDNAAHMGGFVAGALLALFVGYKRPGQRASVAVFWHVLQFAALAIVVVAFGQVARQMGGLRPARLDNPPESQPQVNAATVDSYVEAINEGQDAFRAAINERDTEAANRAIARLDRVAPLAPQADQLRLELKQLLVRAHDLALTGDRERASTRLREQFQQLGADFKAWQKRSDDWVEAEGKNYGIVSSKDDDPAPPMAPEVTPTPQTSPAPSKK
ncbi:MAG TPA: rhomboid family intramembrane serine protease [Pyrinomonadaceae bacterium]|nr:rhomboid family intramembrane serine protease [Pyrinomonadaceae bacterium]